jgi:uncharacterized protein YajQ (UPF0234 family)
MPSFDIVSEVDRQELRNAVDQANREASTRFDFRGTESTISVSDTELVLESSTEARLDALADLLSEKLIRRHVPQAAFDRQAIEEAAKGRARQRIKIKVGVDKDSAKEIGKFIRGLGIKALNVEVQGTRLRVTSKKRDDLQAAIAALKGHDFDIPLQFENFRD